MSVDALAAYLLPKLRRCSSKDEGCAEVLRAMKAGRSLDDALLDTVENLPPSKTLKLRHWIEEARGLMPQRRDATVDEDAARELDLYIDNDRPLYEMKRAVAASLFKKIKSGKYDHKQAWKAWSHVTEAAAKKYARENGASAKEWSTMFTPATRDHVSQQQSDHWYANAKDGREDEV